MIEDITIKILDVQPIYENNNDYEEEGRGLIIGYYYDLEVNVEGEKFFFTIPNDIKIEQLYNSIINAHNRKARNT